MNELPCLNAIYHGLAQQFFGQNLRFVSGSSGAKETPLGLGVSKSLWIGFSRVAMPAMPQPSTKYFLYP